MHAHTVYQITLLAGSWKKTAAFYLRGQKVNSLQKLAWSKCFAQSRLADSQAAFCQVIAPMPYRIPTQAGDQSGLDIVKTLPGGGISVTVADYFSEPDDSIQGRGAWDERGIFHIGGLPNVHHPSLQKYRLPCRREFMAGIYFHPENHVTFAEQYQAWAVRSGVATCPNFDMGALGIVEQER